MRARIAVTNQFFGSNIQILFSVTDASPEMPAETGELRIFTPLPGRNGNLYSIQSWGKRPDAGG